MLNHVGAGRDVEEPAVASKHTFRERAAPEGAVRSLSPAAFGSIDFAVLEDDAIWTRSWVSIGFEDEIAAAGDILPFTVGYHGVHVERLRGGGLAGRFNKAQHGGCRVVPVQCQTGAKTRCSFTACGYSHDRRPIAANAADAERALDQYLGLRPERLLPVAVRTFGGLIAVNLDPSSVAAPSWPDAAASGFDYSGQESADRLGPEATHWVECDADWKLIAHNLALGVQRSSARDFIHTSIKLESDRSATATILFPNAVILTAHQQRCMVILQPVALGRTLCRIRIFGRFPAVESYRSALRGWLADIVPRLSAAEASQVALRFDPTEIALNHDRRTPLRDAGAPAPWLEARISELTQSAPRDANETFYTTRK
ncbi:MAG: hypothetical protein WDN46_07275 [Methylocella sp.]